MNLIERIPTLPAEQIPAAYRELLARARTWVVTGADVTTTIEGTP